MKNLIAIAILAVSLGVASAQTNTPALTLQQTNMVEKSDQWLTEITLGGSGLTTTHGSTEFGLDFSFSIQPLKLPIWVEITQGLAWEPSFAGSTDLDASWAFNIYKEKLYFNLGWSGGVTYDRFDYITRTGPEAYLQYFFTDNVFLYGGAVADLFVSQGEKGFRPNFGVGMSF